jgi:hypothetical protein
VDRFDVSIPVTSQFFFFTSSVGSPLWFGLTVVPLECWLSDSCEVIVPGKVMGSTLPVLVLV